MPTAYFKQGTNSILLVGGMVALDAKCCCQIADYWIDLDKLPFNMASGSTISFNICAFTQAAFNTCTGTCEQCADVNYNSFVNVTAVQVSGCTVNILTPQVHFTAGIGVLSLSATGVGSFRIHASPSVIDSTSFSQCNVS